ncbi:DUF1963 domain-containing protein [Kineosporia babensis]|uniref:DUF1963 domain-containing protein n=1 Tax=Kineosporia babensis TaxID=499548 RepID=A0A9X1NK82_9ACTN|nr:DUF1963 domain-containing protein [Kineosporia babensis]MCD5315683.1 DUF1963 domain-containing protein [Kineosporia babensis]
MPKLMVYAGSAAPDAPGTRTGGVPLAPAGFTWPMCAACGGNMQFLAQIALGEGLLSVFMCQNDPGLCDEWDAVAGGNRAFVFTGELAAVGVPAVGEVQLGEVSAIKIVDVAAPDYDEARRRFGSEEGVGQRVVLGQLGGEPSWLQGEETPDCGDCGKAMTLAAQLEEGHQYETGANFGGGCAYAFHCSGCLTAAFLWQQ